MSKFPEEMYCTAPLKKALDALPISCVSEDPEPLAPVGPGVWGLVAKYKLVSVHRIKRDQSFVTEDFRNE